MADKVLSWNDFNGRLTRKSGHTANQCPSYGDVKSCNSSSVYTSVIRWPAGRTDNRLILNTQLIQDGGYTYHIDFDDNYWNGQHLQYGEIEDFGLVAYKESSSGSRTYINPANISVSAVYTKNTQDPTEYTFDRIESIGVTGHSGIFRIDPTLSFYRIYITIGIVGIPSSFFTWVINREYFDGEFDIVFINQGSVSRTIEDLTRGGTYTIPEGSEIVITGENYEFEGRLTPATTDSISLEPSVSNLEVNITPYGGRAVTMHFDNHGSAYKQYYVYIT